MKRVLFLLIGLVGGLIVSQAQDLITTKKGEKDIFGEVYEGMKYRDLKEIYDWHYYLPEVGDPYNRGWAGVASFFIPGLGQVICGEWGRGACIFAADLALFGITGLGLMAGYENLAPTLPYMIALGAMTGMVALDIWSICDAVNVAKVKNMYYQDLRKMRASMDIKVQPFLTYTPSHSFEGYQPAGGLSLKVSF